MTNRKTPAALPVTRANDADEFKMRSIEQILMLFDGGDFMEEILSGHKTLMQDLLEHNAAHGSKGCEGNMTIQLKYAVGNAGDVGMGATVAFKPPKKPASSAAAYISDAGELTLYSPMMARMKQPVRDVDSYDPDTGEIRDID